MRSLFLTLAAFSLGCNGSTPADTGTSAESGATSEGATATAGVTTEPASSTGGESTGGTTGGGPVTTGTASSATTTTGPAETTAERTSGGAETSAPRDTETGGATTEPGCAAVPVEVVENLALTGPDLCGFVNDDRVFQEQTDLDVWFTEVCPPLEQCFRQSCPPQPAIDWGTSTLLMGDGEINSACGGFFEWEVLDCGDEVQAHYTFHTYGPCEAYLARYETVRAPKLDAPITLSGETVWTLEKPE